MSAAKKRPPIYKSKKNEEQVNKKALIWIGASAGVIIVTIAALMIFG